MSLTCFVRNRVYRSKAVTWCSSFARVDTPDLFVLHTPLLVCWRQVYLNDLLSSGHIPDLYTKDEQLSISESLVEVVKAKGISPEPSACWDYFVQQVWSFVCIGARTILI